MLEAWYQVCGAVDDAALRAVLDTLARREIDAARLQASHPDGPGVVFFDRCDAEVLEFVREVTSVGGARVVAVATSRPALASSSHWALLDAGASDVLDAGDEGVGAMVAARFRRWAEVDAIIQSPTVRANLVGSSLAWRRVLRRVVEVARFTDANVLLIGDTGTGKELLARLIHTLDARRDKAEMVLLDCSTIVGELVGSEFFGHERGAFTGAVQARDGAFALANNGTLFLDEVGELPASLQPQLLRVVQERSFKRVGGTRWESTRFRLVCATNRDLKAEVGRGSFRADLYYRLANCVFHLPPLDQRPDDILPLARHFLTERCPGAAAPDLQAPVCEYLLQRRFPGNVRELRQLISRIMSRRVSDGPVTVGDIPEDERPSVDAPERDWQHGEFEQAIRRALAQGIGLKDISQRAAQTAIRLAVSESDGNLQRAALRLGVTDRALQLRRAQTNDARALHARTRAK